MKFRFAVIDNEFSRISFLDRDVALIEVKDGVEIDADMAKSVHDSIDAELKGDYGVIFNRNTSYSIVPKDVYQVLNNKNRLKAVAIVTYSKLSSAVAELEGIYYQGSFNRFGAIADAQKWVQEQIN